ncbi:GntR family transcriptional regulator [Salinibacterium sp.]|uniref:GntR family transcriptional regulator n=1 Tax=Salinibacterium sp. TaxID=1915057 RepID=UPI00286A80E0|nr:GntR family transcriptional regulator [Salinibacterium sp.]
MTDIFALTSTPITDAIAPPRLKRSVLADECRELIKARIMSHVIKPGERINIEDLVRDLGVSQTPIREAMARLESDGLVAKEPLRGYRTTAPLNRKQVDELYQFRRLIEPWAARVAAERITETNTKAIMEELAACPEAPPEDSYSISKSFSDHDSRFHTLILSFCENRMIIDAFERSHIHLHLFRLHYSSASGTHAIEEHNALARAIASGDADAAEAAMLRHLEASRERISPGVHELDSAEAVNPGP